MAGMIRLLFIPSVWNWNDSCLSGDELHGTLRPDCDSESLCSFVSASMPVLCGLWNRSMTARPISIKHRNLKKEKVIQQQMGIQPNERIVKIRHDADNISHTVSNLLN